MDSSVWGSFRAPGPHTNEELVDRVWFHNPEAADDGTHTIVLHSRGSGSGRPMGLYFRYDLEQMPELTTWSHMVAGEYICGIEPCVTHAAQRRPVCARLRAVRGLTPSAVVQRQRQYAGAAVASRAWEAGHDRPRRASAVLH